MIAIPSAHRIKSVCRVLLCLTSAVLAVNAGVVRAAVQPWELWKINADGGGLALFAESPDYTCGSPDWSPDGKTIIFASGPAVESP